MFQLGFVSAILAECTFEEVIDFAAAEGFSHVEIMCWPKGTAERRYAGVTHLDVDNLDVDYTLAYCQKKGVSISALGYYPNPLDANTEKREEYINHLKKLIKAAQKLKIGLINTFIGRHKDLNLDQNIALYKTVWAPLLALAKENNVKIGIENCPMYFTNDEWPDGKNIAINAKVWEQLWAVENAEILGLNYDPSHLLWMQMDYIAPLLEYTNRLFHLHLKDAHVDQQAFKRLGVLATPLEYHSPKLPGRGDIDWIQYLKILKQINYTGPLIIEFEDKEFEGNIALITKGLRATKQYITNIYSKVPL
jgi:sugar phosphate isomerase/epimerase